MYYKRKEHKSSSFRIKLCFPFPVIYNQALRHEVFLDRFVLCTANILLANGADTL